MRTFNGLDKFATYLKEIIPKYPVYEKKWGDFSADVLEKEAKDKIGHLQEGWEPLAESTKRDKERLGYVFNADYNPLYREGDLRDSIKGHYNLSLHKLFLGSFSIIMVYQALGTPTIPARDPIGSTMLQAALQILMYLSKTFLAWLENKPLVLRRITHGNI